jgi:CRP-like cAMP-binding protein
VTSSSIARLSELDADLLALLPDEVRIVGGPQLRVVSFERGLIPHAVLADGLSFIVVDGLIAQVHQVRDRLARVLVWSGDVLPVPTEAVTLEAVTPVRLAIIDSRVLRLATHWPDMLGELARRLGALQGRTAIAAALGQLPRVDERILLLFTLMAEELGKVSADGVLVDVPLTHQLLGTFVGARRPTVTLALRDLADQGLLRRREDGVWVVDRRALESGPDVLAHAA